MKPHWLHGKAGILHVCKGYSSFIGRIFITHSLNVAIFPIKFTASNLLTVLQIRPSIGNSALIHHSDAAEPK